MAHKPPALRACAVCQLGGLIYFTLMGIIVLVLVNFLPLINFCFQLLFDGCVACCDAVRTKEGRTKLRKNVGQARSMVKQARAMAKRPSMGASAGAGNGAAFDASNVNLTAQQLRSLKREQLADGRQRAPVGASLGQRLRRMGAHIVNLGSPASQESRGLLSSQEPSVSPPASPPAAPPPPHPHRTDAWA